MTNHAEPWPEIAPADYWEERYGGPDRVWSGKVNRVLAHVASTLTPGRALDLGCGEGGDVVWLAQQGWEATGIDISASAVRRASEAARNAGLSEAQARFEAADLAALADGTYDLVTASFLHSPVELPRAEILRKATARVAPGGHLLITSHADFPPGSDVPHGHEHNFLSPEEELAQLRLDPEVWETLIAETRQREAVLRNGEQAVLDDVVVLVRRHMHAD